MVSLYQTLPVWPSARAFPRSEEHTSELQSRGHLVCRLLLEKKKPINTACSFIDLPLLCLLFLFLIPRPLRSTLFPYTTLFRSPLYFRTELYKCFNQDRCLNSHMKASGNPGAL